MSLQLARNAGLGERRHSGVARNGGPKNERPHHRAGGFAKPHAEVQQRLEPEFVEEHAVCGFRRHMRGDGVGQPIGPQHSERSDRSRAHKAVDEHRNTLPAGCQRGAQDGGKLAASSRPPNAAATCSGSPRMPA